MAVGVGVLGPGRFRWDGGFCEDDARIRGDSVRVVKLVELSFLPRRRLIDGSNHSLSVAALFSLSTDDATRPEQALRHDHL